MERDLGQAVPLPEELGGLGHDSTERITLTKTTRRDVRKLLQLHKGHASSAPSRTPPDVVGDENHVRERARSPRCAPQYLREKHMGRETKNPMRYWAEENPKGGCGIVSNSPNGRRREKASDVVHHDLSTKIYIYFL